MFESLRFGIFLYFRGPAAPLPFQAVVALFDNVNLAPKVIQGQSATPIPLVTAPVTHNRHNLP